MTFAVASITPTSDARFYPVTIGRDGRLVWKSVSLSRLIRTAYRTQKFDRIAGMPGAFDSDRFDIEATAEGSPSEDEMWAMVRNLLADRLELQTHLETRDLPVYLLVRGRSDGGLGGRIRPSACVARETVSLPPGPLDPSRPIPLPCGGIRSVTVKGDLQARFATIAELAAALSQVMDRPIEDRTGLAGRFDLEVEWTPAPDSPGPPAPGVGPAMFAAIEEQLGLRLDPATGPVDVLVIDRAVRPVPGNGR